MRSKENSDQWPFYPHVATPELNGTFRPSPWPQPQEWAASWTRTWAAHLVESVLLHQPIHLLAAPHWPRSVCANSSPSPGFFLEHSSRVLSLQTTRIASICFMMQSRSEQLSPSE